VVPTHCAALAADAADASTLAHAAFAVFAAAAITLAAAAIATAIAAAIAHAAFALASVLPHPDFKLDSRAMTKLCVCGKTVKVTDRIWAYSGKSCHLARFS
jgi:hypothetical protein